MVKKTMRNIIWLLFCLGAPGIALSAGVEANATADVEMGKKLYDQVCAYCHHSNYDDKIGPGLGGISERRSSEWLSDFLLNPAEVIRNDEYAQSLKESNKYNMTMPALPQMKDDAARANVIAYMKTFE